MARKILLSLNHCAASLVEDINGKKVRMRHGDDPVEISEKLYNVYKEQSSTVLMPISDKRLNVVIPKYLFTFIDDPNSKDD